jgi:hypothetical protein
MKPIHSVFYSWQSDLNKDTNLNGIRQALREASSQVEGEIDDTRIELDEATRNTTGSPNIPITIFDKISACDVFICDLTTINSTSPTTTRKTPNPNVLIELGFAIATLGWDRIIMLFNTNYGKFPDDLPFDIDRHRATPFLIKDKKDNNGKSKLAQILKISIQAIIQKSPLKPDEKRTVTPEQRKRKIDVTNLRLALNTISIPTFDNFTEELPDIIISKIFYFKDCFNIITDSNTFHIYDSVLLEKLLKFKENWNKSLSFYQHYGPNGFGKNYKFYIPMDIFPSDQAEKDYNKIARIKIDLQKDFKGLLKYVRNNYLEIDLDETSKTAFAAYKSDMEK